VLQLGLRRASILDFVVVINESQVLAVCPYRFLHRTPRQALREREAGGTQDSGVAEMDGFTRQDSSFGSGRSSVGEERLEDSAAENSRTAGGFESAALPAT